MGGFALPPQIMQKLFQGQQNPLYPQQQPAPQGAPVDFGGQVLPNPDNVQPRADTDPGPATKLYGGAKLSTPTFKGPMGTDISNPPKNQLEQGPMQTASAQEPARGAISSAMKPPMNEAEFSAANPDAAKAFLNPRPVGDFDTGNHPHLRNALASLFAGLAEFGRPGAGQSFVNRWADQNIAQRQYDAGLPKMKAGALNQAYQQYLQQGGEQANIQHTQAETTNLQQNVPLLQHQQQFLDKVRGLKEKGNYPSDQDLFNAVLPEASTIPGLTRQMIVDQINQAKPLGPQFNVTADKGGRPEFIQDRAGQKYYPDAQGKFANPEMQKQWDSEMQSHQQSIGEEEGKEKRVAGYAADRQAQAFSNQQTEQGRKAASGSLQEINDAKNQQTMMEKLLTGKMNPASQTAAMFKLIGLEQPTGTHRIMPAEIEGVEQLGGLSDRLKQKLLSWKDGDRFDPDLIPDVISTAKTLTQNKIKTANDNLESTARVYGYKAPGSDGKGRLDKPEDYQDAAGGGGDVIYARDPQGKLHKAAKGTALPQGWKAENAPAAK